MDKSPSTNYHEVDDGSWDLDENIEESLQELDNLSTNSWDSVSEKGNKDYNEIQETTVQAFREDDVDETADSCHSSKVIKTFEKPASSIRESESSDSISEICLPIEEGKCLFDEVREFEYHSDRNHVESKFGTIPEINGIEESDKFSEVEDVIPFKNSENIEPHLVVEDLEASDHITMKAQEPDADDESVCKIVLSCRTASSKDTTVSSPVGMRAFITKKSKSDSNILRSVTRMKKSKSCGTLTVLDNTSLKDVFTKHEGSCMQEMEENKENKWLQDIVEMGDRTVCFQEIECRTLWAGNKDIKVKNEDSKEDVEEPRENCSRLSRAGRSSNVSEEATSLPNIAGAGKSEKYEFRKTASHITNQKAEEDSEMQDNNLSESWILLDETGQSQRITMLEVRFLLNGRSADSVLQENKEHFIPGSSCVRNANSELIVDHWGPLVKESLQHLLQEDTVGEEACKTVGLERKFGNMLLYIQSGVNVTSSVRFIPVDTEIIHMWRQSKENVSPISSEDDTRIHVCYNNTQETPDYDKQGTSHDIRDRNYDVRSHSPSVRKRKITHEANECDHSISENRKIIDVLTDKIKQLNTRLEAERSRSSGLEQEIGRLRTQLDKCRSEQNTTKSQNPSQLIEETSANDIHMVPQIKSSSILSVEELKNDGNRQDVVVNNDPKSFKEALDKNLNDIEEILKCKAKPKAKSSKECSSKENGDKKNGPSEDRAGIFSSVAVARLTMIDTTSHNSETTSNVDSWFHQKKINNSHRHISEIINELENENEQLVRENTDLKKKLNEISVELEEYVSNSMTLSPVEEGKQMESLRNQVCNLKLELEELKSLTKSKEHSYLIKDAILREELAEKSVSVEEWRKIILNIFHDINKSREKLREMGLTTSNCSREFGRLKPDDLLNEFRSLMTRITMKIEDFQKENNILKQSIKDFTCHGKRKVCRLQCSTDMNFLQEVPAILLKNASEDLKYDLDLEDAALEEQLKNLRKENEVLLQSHIDSTEKLKSTTISLLEEKSKVESLEIAVKTMTVEKSDCIQALELCNKEKTIVQGELEEKSNEVVKLKMECERNKSDIRDLEERIREIMEKYRDFDELKRNYQELQSRESLHIKQVQSLADQLQKLDGLKVDLEEELRLANLEAEESSRGKLQYIQHLETMVSNAEQSLADMKHKYNETSKSLTSLKKTHEDLEKQNSNGIKIFNKAKDELEGCKELIRDLEGRNKMLEEAKKKSLCDLKTIVKSEKAKTETLEKLITERKILDEELSSMRNRADMQARARDRLMKEQKDLMNEIATLKKQNAKMGQKYQHVKLECNERTKLLRRLDVKLKENFIEYNKRIACLERNVCNIIEKAAAYKNSFQEKHSEVNAVIRELQEQLNTVSNEKRDLESEFSAAVIQLQKQISEKRLKKLNVTSEMGNDAKESSEYSIKIANHELENKLKRTEIDLLDLQEKMRQLEYSKEEDRAKYEGIIADLKTQIRRDQLRLDILLKNISSSEKNTEDSGTIETSKILTLEQKILDVTNEVDRKRKRIIELTEAIENNEVVMRKKEEECEASKQKVVHLKEEIRNMKNQFSKLQEFLSTVSKNVETYQKERDEIAGKLAKSLKVIVEERASKQSTAAVFGEKEKLFKSQLEDLQERLTEKKKDYEELLKTVEEKRLMVSKLQDDVKKWKGEAASLRTQMESLMNQRYDRQESESNSENAKLREMREVNLELRKKEGQLKAAIVRLEDDLRGARLLIKELEGDLRTEKNSKCLLRDMIASARQDINKFKRAGQIRPLIAEKIERHFDLSQEQSRELFSGYRTAAEDEISLTLR